ncbi:MAG: thioredoxin family protein [Elusimicrobiota bacterium]
MTLVWLWLAGAVAAAPVQRPHISVELVSARESAADDGSALVGLDFRLEPGWHVYWSNPGDSGEPVRVDWDLPAGASAGPIAWPVPERIALPPLAIFGYEGRVLLAAPLSRFPGGLVASRASWLVCDRGGCVPGQARLSLKLSRGGPARATRSAGAFEAAARRVPRRDPAWTARGRATQEAFVLDVFGPEAATSASFFPYSESVVSAGMEPVFAPRRGGFTLTLGRSALLEPGKTPLQGVLAVRSPAGERFIELSPTWAQGAARAALAAMGLAFLGGLILNVMPCVFPILCLKLLAVARLSGAQVHEARRQHLAYAGGVLVSFWLLAAALAVLRRAGLSLGWGFQLQSPGFVAFLAVVMLALALNLLGAFEIGASWMGFGQDLARRPGLWGSFFSGALAVVVATPCTAPFMGVALAFALTASPLETFAVYTALGLGFCAPFLLLARFPGLNTRLPRPGPWMEKVRKAMSLPLLATAVWLVTVLVRQLAPAPAVDARWSVYSPEAVSRALAEGRPAFVDFTAAWCLTCQVNERLALDTEAVQREFARRRVALFRADWTSRDPQLAERLQSFGRDGVPLYVFYRPGKAEPEIWPQILTPGSVISRLD